jgi:hypothetical protein
MLLEVMVYNSHKLIDSSHLQRQDQQISALSLTQSHIPQHFESCAASVLAESLLTQVSHTSGLVLSNAKTNAKDVPRQFSG